MSFISPLFLLAAGFAVLPIIFHLIRKMKAKTVPFSSLMFIKATPIELIKYRRLRDLLLMLIRAALLGLLAFAFARPFIPKDKIPFISQDIDRSVVIMIDNSMSMQYNEINETAFAKAVEILDDGGTNDEFSVILFAEKPVQLSVLSKDKQIHRNAINRADKSTFYKTNFYTPVKLSQEILKDAANPRKQVYMISDFQSSGWKQQFENWKIDPEIEFLPVNVLEETSNNIYFANYRSAVRRNTGKISIEFEAQVAAEDENEITDLEVELFLNGDYIEKKKVEKTSGNRVYFQRENMRPGTYQGILKLPDDNFDRDNELYFNFIIEPNPKILSLSNRDDEVLYLKNAFDLGDNSIFDITIRGRTPYSRAYLPTNDMVILNNISSLTAQQLVNLTEYVESGGTLFISFGERANIRQYRTYFSTAGSGWGVGEIMSKVTVRNIQRSDAIIGEIDLKHPIFADFRSSGASDIFKPKFREYIKIMPDSSAKVLGSFDTGDPFLIEKNLGKGKVVVFTSSLNTAWTDFPIREIYLPFLYQIADYSSRNNYRQSRFLVGESVEFDTENTEWEIKAPADRIYKVDSASDEESLGITKIPGNYLAESSANIYNFSVNADPEESVFRYRDPDEVYSSITVPAHELEIAKAELDPGRVTEEEKEQKFWRVIIILMILLSIVETVFANRKLSLKL